MSIGSASDATPLGDPAVRPALRHLPAFRSFWLSRLISVLGTAITSVALPVITFQQTGSPVLVALISAAGTLPYLVFGLIAGTVADRRDRRQLMIATDWLSAAVIATVPAAWALGILTGWQLVAVALTASSLALFFDAGVYGFVPEVVGRDGLAEANSSLYLVETVARIAGTAVAGGLIALVRPAGTLAVDALTFVASALLLRAVATMGRGRVRTPDEGRPGFRESVREGIRFLWGNSTLRVLTAVGTLQSFSGGAIVGQLVVFADRSLHIHGNDGRIGFLYTAWSAGGIAGSLLLPRLLRWVDAFSLLLAVLPVGALLGVVVVLSTDWRVTLAALTAWGSAYLVVLVNTMTYSQQVTPLELQSRVNTTRRMLSSGLGVPLGALVSSSITVGFGIRAGMSTAVVAIGLAALVVWTVRLAGGLPVTRRPDRGPEGA